jgi:hypothetical protein
LASNIENGNNDVKEASFQALGYVCEECAASLQEQSNIVLTLIAKGMHKDQISPASNLPPQPLLRIVLISSRITSSSRMTGT